jgi:hypothetical protein
MMRKRGAGVRREETEEDQEDQKIKGLFAKPFLIF